MNRKVLYFHNIDQIGDLFLDQILDYFEVPVVFTCTDKNDNFYLCLCSEVRKVQRWVITYIDTDNLISLINDKISIYDAIKSTSEIKYILEKSVGAKELSVEKVKFSEINELHLPEKDLYLELPDEEKNSYLYRLTRMNVKKYMDSYVSPFAKTMTINHEIWNTFHKSYSWTRQNTNEPYKDFWSEELFNSSYIFKFDSFETNNFSNILLENVNSFSVSSDEISTYSSINNGEKENDGIPDIAIAA